MLFRSIPNGEFVIINRPVSGGGSDCAFANMEDSGCIETHHFKASAPDWRYATSGLNIEGVCKNSSCKAYKKQVICKIGYGAFDLISDKGGCKCPICKVLIDPITCGFTNCYYNWTGRKKNDSTNKVELCKGRIWKKVGNVYEYYNPLKSETVKWCQLKIHATRGLNEKCAVCNSYVGHDSIDFSTKPCGHRYHNSCFEKIKDILKRECPACYNN